jgi:hypothetical protein
LLLPIGHHPLLTTAVAESRLAVSNAEDMKAVVDNAACEMPSHQTGKFIPAICDALTVSRYV